MHNFSFTDFPTTTHVESSDSSDDDNFRIRRPTIDSESSEDSGDSLYLLCNVTKYTLRIRSTH